MKNRVLYEVTPYAFGLGLLGWKVTRNLRDGKRSPSHRLVWFANKDDAVAYAVAECKFWRKSLNENSELKIKNKWGIIVDSRTYGDDPRGNG